MSQVHYHILGSRIFELEELPSAEFQRVSRGKTEAFQRLLLAQGLHATIRESRGPDIAAACGQLAAKTE